MEKNEQKEIEEIFDMRDKFLAGTIDLFEFRTFLDNVRPELLNSLYPDDTKTK